MKIAKTIVFAAGLLLLAATLFALDWIPFDSIKGLRSVVFTSTNRTVPQLILALLGVAFFSLLYKLRRNHLKELKGRMKEVQDIEHETREMAKNLRFRLVEPEHQLRNEKHLLSLYSKFRPEQNRSLYLTVSQQYRYHVADGKDINRNLLRIAKKTKLSEVKKVQEAWEEYTESLLPNHQRGE